MSKQQRSAIDLTCKANITTSLAEGEAAQGPAIKKNVKERGVTVKKLDPKLLKDIENAWQETVTDLLLH